MAKNHQPVVVRGCDSHPNIRQLLQNMDHRKYAKIFGYVPNIFFWGSNAICLNAFGCRWANRVSHVFVLDRKCNTVAHVTIYLLLFWTHILIDITGWNDSTWCIRIRSMKVFDTTRIVPRTSSEDIWITVICCLTPKCLFERGWRVPLVIIHDHPF